MPELLLELLSEEIPARMQARAAEDLKRLVCEGLERAQLAYMRADEYVTPRRLALVVEGLPDRQPDVREERKGPRVGSPDAAIQGFLRASRLAEIDQAEIRDTEKGKFHFAVRIMAGLPIDRAIVSVLGDAIDNLPWPKSMRWRDTDFRWVRPLQNVLAMVDNREIIFECDLIRTPDTVVNPRHGENTLKANNRTIGHRFLAPDWFEVRNFADYKEKLRAAKVIVDQSERRARILDEARRLAAAEGLRLREDEALLDEVTGLVEWPVIMLGRIDPAFMEVPPEVLVSAMRRHQKYFSLLNADGKLAPWFVLVANTEATDGGKAIVAGNERVLRARLSDAKFFWDEDRKRSLESRVPKLAERVFHAKLGSDLARAERLAAFARVLARFCDADPDMAKRAARLCKADLTTAMVGEFPELQGLMGSYYALHDGEPADVAQAIAEHYAPQGPSDHCPTAPVSVAVALADKIDTLTGFFAIGEQPTGSKDPFALRRAALGVLRIIIENRVRLNLRPSFLEVYFAYVEQIDSEVCEELFYLFERHGLDLNRLRELVYGTFLSSLLDRDHFVSNFLNYAHEASEPNFTDPMIQAFSERLENRLTLIELAHGPRLDALYGQSDEQTLKETLEGYLSVKDQIRAFAEPLADDLLAFFADRLKVHLREQGVRHDLIAAVFAGGAEDDIVRLLARVDALRDFLDTEDGANLLVAYRRASNIVRIEENNDGTIYDGEADESLLEQQQEIELYRGLAEARARIAEALSGERFGDAMVSLAGLRAPVDAFFDHVTVNCANSHLRVNRLRLLSQIRSALGGVADFSQIEG
jgi:glycyl-tRNA synthetase beta chain